MGVERVEVFFVVLLCFIVIGWLVGFLEMKIKGGGGVSLKGYLLLSMSLKLVYLVFREDILRRVGEGLIG